MAGLVAPIETVTATELKETHFVLVSGGCGLKNDTRHRCDDKNNDMLNINPPS